MPDDVTPVYEGIGAPNPNDPNINQVFSGVGARPPQPASPVDAANQQSALQQRFSESGIFQSDPNQLIEEAIRGRQGIEQRRQQLIGEIQASGRGRKGRANIGAMTELKELDRSDQQLAAQHHYADQQKQFDARERRISAHQDMQQNLQLAKQDRETDIDEHGAALVSELPRLRAALRNGQISKDEYDSSLLDTIGKYGALGMHHPGASQLVNHYVEEADKLNAFEKRRNISEATKLAGRYGIEPQVDPETGLPSVEHTRSAALQTPKGRVEMLTSLNQEMKQKYGLGTGVSSLFNPVEPHSSPDNGKTTDIPFLEPKTGKIGKANIPTPLFEQMKADFGDRYFATVPQQQSQQSDPRIELAQRALNDPKASEAHKSAATQILKAAGMAASGLPMMAYEMSNDPNVNPNPPILNIAK